MKWTVNALDQLFEEQMASFNFFVSPDVDLLDPMLSGNKENHLRPSPEDDEHYATRVPLWCETLFREMKQRILEQAHAAQKPAWKVPFLLVIGDSVRLDAILATAAANNEESKIGSSIPQGHIFNRSQKMETVSTVYALIGIRTLSCRLSPYQLWSRLDEKEAVNLREGLAYAAHAGIASGEAIVAAGAVYNPPKAKTIPAARKKVPAIIREGKQVSLALQPGNRILKGRYVTYDYRLTPHKDAGT